jgi:hypothetical protein
MSGYKGWGICHVAIYWGRTSKNAQQASFGELRKAEVQLRRKPYIRSPQNASSVHEA